MTFLVRAPQSYLPERRYVLDLVLKEWLGVDYELTASDGPDVSLQLADEREGSELTLPDTLFSTPPEDWLTQRSMPVTPLSRVDTGMRPRSDRRDELGSAASLPPAGTIPVVFGRGAEGPAVVASTTGLAFAVDVFGSAFYLLTRYEEAVLADRDRHGRFPAGSSLSGAENLFERPIVDEYVELLWSAMHSLWPRVTRRSTTFRLRPTHDVDEPWAARRPRALAGDVLYRHDVRLASRRLRSILDARSGRVDRDPYNTFDFLMESSERYGLRSTFYFLAGNAPGDIDYRYGLTDPPFATLLRRIDDRGHEIGLHASYGSYLSADRTQREFEALRAACRAAGFDQPTWGVRQHYLRFENPQTWRNHESAGLDHDSTLGFVDQVGFRAGTCREFPLFDVRGRRTLDLRERPLVVMDGALLGHMDLGLDDATSRIRDVVSQCRRYQGDAVLLYHNHTVAGTRHRAHYRDLIAELARPDRSP